MTITQRPWGDRPTDIANLINPAFSGMMIRQAVDGYKKLSNHGMPFELTFLVLPIVLHEATRSRLPTIATTFQTWLPDNKDLLPGFAQRAHDLVPFTREAIAFSMLHNVLRIEPTGNVESGSLKLRGVTAFQQKSEEVRDVYKKSQFIGRWLSQAGNSTTVFAMLGVKP